MIFTKYFPTLMFPHSQQFSVPVLRNAIGPSQTDDDVDDDDDEFIPGVVACWPITGEHLINVLE